MNTSQNEIVLYQPNTSLALEVRLEDETVWLTQSQMAELFQTTRNNVTMHISNIFKEGELEKPLVCKDFLHTTQHGAIVGKFQQKNVKIFNLDVIISVGYRIKSQQGTHFRQWANRILKDYLLKGYAIHQRIERLEYKINIFSRSHDRFLIIDETVYHIGASLKDLGKRWFAFSKMELEAGLLLQNL